MALIPGSQVLLLQISTDIKLKYCIIIIISGSTVLVRTLAASHRKFRNLT